MQAIEFETYLDNGVVHLPSSYQYWQQGKQVKVIILGSEESGNPSQQVHQESPVSCLELIQEDIGILENAPSDLSTNPAYLRDYGQ